MRTFADGWLPEGSPRVHPHLRRPHFGPEQASDLALVLNRGAEPLCGLGEEVLPITHHHQLEDPLEPHLLLHDLDKLTTLHLQERASVRQRVGTELLPQPPDRRAHPLDGELAITELR